MIISNKSTKLFATCSFKLIVISLIILLVLNLLLLRNLRSSEYERNPSARGAFEHEKVPQKKTKTCTVGNYTLLYTNRIIQLKDSLGEFYKKTPYSVDLVRRCKSFVDGLSSDDNEPFKLFSPIDDQLNFANGHIFKFLKNSPILSIENLRKGTQLKLLLHLKNNVTAVFKPKWYPPLEIMNGPVYSGKDRHYGELLAFFLSILLDLRRVPVTIIRKLDTKKELLPLSDQKLLNTFILKDNNMCFYGVCHYCKSSDLLCTNSTGFEGAVIFYLPSELKLKTTRHPWQRTYKCNRTARWEIDEDYCSSVRVAPFYADKKNAALFYDLIDVSIFDFLISNGDRHHYESAEINQKRRIIIIDNGKSFGNPYTDHIDILAPLYHCCVIRNSTWNNLLHLRGGNLSTWLRYLIKNSEEKFVINELHLVALDRRLMIVFTVLKDCFVRKGMQNVIFSWM